MKTMIRILGITAVIAVIAVAAMPTASANCIPNKTLSSIANANGYFYVNLPAGSDNTNVVGRFWQAGARALANEGTFDDTFWLREFQGRWYILGELGTAGVVGCPTGSLILTLDTASGQNVTIQLDETPAGAAAFDLGRFNSDFTPGSKPRPQVQNSVRPAGSPNVTGNLVVQAQTGGIYTLGAAVAATPTYRLVTAAAAADPGGGAVLYTPGAAVTPGAPTPFSADCSNPAVDQWIAVQTIIDGVPSDTVSPRTRISCNPAMADPKFKHIDRPVRPSPRSER